MLKTRVIPILLLQGNSVVKTVGFSEPRVVGDAISNVNVFSNRMADEMVIVDIEATEKGRINEALIRRLARQCVMPLTVGGGIQTLVDAQALFRSGADKVVINSAFYKDPSLFSQVAAQFGRQALVFSLDAVKTANGYQAVSHSGNNVQSLSAVAAAQLAVSHGAGEVLVNSIDCDGRMEGYDLDLVEAISASVDVPVVAAGGCGSSLDCVNAVNAGASAVAAGSIFYWVGESIITLKETMANNNIEVRLI